jgi:hypothetical protein
MVAWKRRVCALVVASLSFAGCGAAAAPKKPSEPPPDESGLWCKEGTAPRRGVGPFNLSTMTRPRLVDSRAPLMTSYAHEHRLQGMILSKCVITGTGALEDCCIVKGVDGLNGMVLEAVRTWRYEPATVDGRPVEVLYIVPVKIVQ